jgi:hypothetical protein
LVGGLEHKRPGIAFAGSRGRRERRRCRLPDAGTGCRRGERDVHRGGVQTIACALHENERGLLLALSNAGILGGPVGDCGQGRGQGAIQLRLLSRHLCQQRIVQRLGESGVGVAGVVAVFDRARGREPSDRPGSALGDGLGKRSGGHGLVGDVIPLKGQACATFRAAPVMLAVALPRVR